MQNRMAGLMAGLLATLTSPVLGTSKRPLTRKAKRRAAHKDRQEQRRRHRASKPMRIARMHTGLQWVKDRWHARETWWRNNEQGTTVRYGAETARGDLRREVAALLAAQGKPFSGRQKVRMRKAMRVGMA